MCNPGRGQEEPFALAAISRILPAISSRRTQALTTLGIENFRGLRRFLGLANGSDGCRFGNRRNEPVAFIVTAEKLLLFGAVANQEQQVAVAGLSVKNGNHRLGLRRSDNLKKLAVAVFRDIKRDGCRGDSREPPGWPVADLHTAPIRANFVIRLLVSMACLRESKDTSSQGLVHA